MLIGNKGKKCRWDLNILHICKSTSRTICFEPIHVFSNNYDKFAQRKLLLSSDVELNPGSSDIMDTVLSDI